MKNINLCISALLAIAAGMAGCSGNSGTGSSSDTTSNTTTNKGDSAVTTTTTTTITHHRYSGTFMPKPGVKYIDLKTHKQVSVTIDTTLGQIVNTENNQPIDLFIEPTTHDTIYGPTGTVVNNYIIRSDNGDLNVDTAKMNSAPATDADAMNSNPADHNGNYKEKDRDNKRKVKTDDYKLKEKNGEVIKDKEK